MPLLRRRTVLSGLAASAVAVPVFAQDAVTLRLHQFLPPQSSVPRLALAPWAQQLEKDSGGKLKIQMFPSMQLGGKPPELLDQAKDGVVDLAWVVLGYTPGRFPKAEAFELPFNTGPAQAGSLAFQEFVQTHAMDEFGGVKLLAVHVHGPGTIHSRTPVTKLEDIKAMRVRGGSRVINIMLEQVGAVPVGMPVPAVGEALSKGVIDAATLPWEVVPSIKAQQIVKNHTQFSGNRGLYTQTFALVMNQARYNKLPPELRRMIDARSGAALAGLCGRAMDEGDVGGVAAVQKAGNRIITLDGAETQRWQRAASGVRAAWYNEVAPKGIDGEKLAAAATALVAKYSKPA
jgi:TRAP-type C4-dicarboxylate transport system substrate-binding protein